MLLHLFVYGSLKVGHCNYDQVARWVAGVEPARVQGRLVLRPDGYPALRIARASRWGSADVESDLQAQDQPLPAQPAGGTGWVRGELLRLESAARALPHLDRFEGYVPGVGSSEYRRVLVPVHLETGGPLWAWTYVGSQRAMSGWPRIDEWPPPGSPPPGPYTGGGKRVGKPRPLGEGGGAP